MPGSPSRMMPAGREVEGFLPMPSQVALPKAPSGRLSCNVVRSGIGRRESEFTNEGLIGVRTIHLHQPWQSIDEDLLALVA